jgi:hypothetical protein
LGIPGTGTYYTSFDSYYGGVHSAHREAPLTAESAGQDRAVGWVIAAIVVAVVVIVWALVRRWHRAHER